MDRFIDSLNNIFINLKFASFAPFFYSASIDPHVFDML